jgi:hypothetical protein
MPNGDDTSSIGHGSPLQTWNDRYLLGKGGLRIVAVLESMPRPGNGQNATKSSEANVSTRTQDV